MDFGLQDNWLDVPGFREKVLVWEKLSGAPSKQILRVAAGDQEWRIRLNDFPDEPLYTLIVDGREIIHFNDWPQEWTKP